MRRAFRLVARRIAVRQPDEQGAALVEAVIIIPLLMLLTFGAIELGIGFNQKAALESLTRAGARTGATLANDTTTDPPNGETADNDIGFDTAKAVNAAIHTTALPDIRRLVVYKIAADGTSTFDGTNCSDVGCITFGYDTSTHEFDLSSINGTWPLDQRHSCTASADRIAVRVEGYFHFLTGLIGTNAVPLTSTTVLQLEPTQDCSTS